MANKQIFSYGNNGKRKIGHSKFDMGHEHIMSGNFGALLPAACFETLPDDYWDVSDNTVTLLKPLTAPAFTRINQNFYGAYVRNQQIWKYWNDFISNGTAFGDVYGNNVTNQNLQNIWKVPSIPTPYLQTILKIGYGNATPVFHFVTSCTDSLSGDILAAFLKKSIDFKNVTDDTAYRVTDAIMPCFCQSTCGDASLDGVLTAVKEIAFTQYSYDVWVVHSSNTWYFLFSVYCSLRQWLALRGVLIGGLSTSLFPTPSEIGSNESDTYSTPLNNFNSLWRFFGDEISADPSTSESAFLVEKSNYQGQNGDILKSLDYYPRLIDTKVDSILLSNYQAPDFVYQCIQSSFWGFRYHAWYSSIADESFIEPSDCALASFDRTSTFFWQINTANFGYSKAKNFDALFESFAFDVHYLGVTCAYSSVLDSFYGDSASPLVVSFDSTGKYYVCPSFGGNLLSIAGSLVDHFRVEAYCDTNLPLVIFQNISSSVSCQPPSSVTSRESLSLGYDAYSMITYLCQSSSILMENFGIKSDPLSARPFYHYRFETTNALPFFAYSKIWGDNFRNSVVSSPEIDYSESNGEIFADQAFYQHFVFGSQFREPAVRPTRYQGKVYTDFASNGWTLEIVSFPRNSQGSKIHTHLPIKSFAHVFTFLSGSNFDGYFSSLSGTELNVFDYYMPTYYNGLLHLKYQNFNKDYFTSALLDPMSGANQVSVGSTINELRENEAKQHWWERTAMYRSIKSWFQGTYGITPIELPEDSRITGTDHVDVNIGEVIQTSGTTPESPQGQRSGLGGCRGSGTLVHGHANEHGWIIILVSHTVESQYMQVYDKMWDVKDSFLDYPTVDFASVGNESILQKEVNYTTVPTEYFDWNFYKYTSAYPSGVSYLPVSESSGISYRGKTNPIRKTAARSGKFNITSAAGTSLDNIFGFIPRYSSYKFKFDQVSGQFRHELKFWHTFKRYLTSPILCHEFVNWEMAADDEEINRIFAVSDDLLDDKFNIDCFINAHVDRALPFVCVPMSK